ncbi:conserved Plasmodium protein, unknown function [Plasmodium ovale curtisi]|uniref:Uncharacterized protein n=1 Tax=Plasmodium ovale curtisi TaxID=864141 RepID=A0A1A8WJC2_PLAOA|nr:conserved Plasmodium protein, unknown function [Plasmodium ovale curtisi]
MRDIYTECKKDLITLEKLTLEALERGNALLFEQLVEVSTLVNRSIKVFEDFEKGGTKGTPKIAESMYQVSMNIDRRDSERKKKHHEGEKKNETREKKYKMVDEEDENDKRSRSKSRSRSRSGSRGKRKDYEKRKKKKKEKEKEKKYYPSDDNSKEKYFGDNKNMFKSESLDSFSKEFGNFHDTNILSSEMDEEFNDFNVKQKSRKKKKKKLHDSGKLKFEGSNNEYDFLDKNNIDSLDDFNLSNSGFKHRRNSSKKDFTSTSNLVIIIHISDIINVSLDLRNVCIYLTLKSLDNKIYIRKKSRNKNVENFSINVSELFEFSIFYNNQLFLTVDVIDSLNNTYYYTCLININKNILKKTKYFTPTAYLLTKVTENFNPHQQLKNGKNVSTNPSILFPSKSFGCENIKGESTNFEFIGPTVDMYPGMNNNFTDINLSNNMKNNYNFNRSVNYIPNFYNMNYMSKSHNNPNYNNFNFASRNFPNRSVNNFNFSNPNRGNHNFVNPNVGNSNVGNPKFGNSNYANLNFVNPNYANPNFCTPNFGNPNFGNPNFRNPNFGNPNFGNPNFGNPNFGNPLFKRDPFDNDSNNNTASNVDQEKDSFEKLSSAAKLDTLETTKDRVMKGNECANEIERKNELNKMEGKFSSSSSYIIMNIFLKNKDFDHETELMKQNNLNLYKELYNVCNKEKMFYENKSKENEKKIEQLDKAVMLLELDNESYIDANNKLKEIIESNKEIIKFIENMVKKKNSKIEKLEKENEKVHEAEKLIEENRKENNYLSEKISKLNTIFNEHKSKLKDSNQINNNLNGKVNNLLFQLQNAQMKNEKLLLYLSFLLKHIHQNSCSGEHNSASIMKLKRMNCNIENATVENYNTLLEDHINNYNYVKENAKYNDLIIKKFIGNQRKVSITPQMMEKIFGLYSSKEERKMFNFSDNNGDSNDHGRRNPAGEGGADSSINGNTNLLRKENYKMLKGAPTEEKEELLEGEVDDLLIDDYLVNGYKKYMSTTSSNDIREKRNNGEDFPISKKIKGKKKSNNNDVFDSHLNSDEVLSSNEENTFSFNMKKTENMEKRGQKKGEEKKNYHYAINEKRENIHNDKHLNNISDFKITNNERNQFSNNMITSGGNGTESESNSTFSFHVKKRDELYNFTKSKRNKKCERNKYIDLKKGRNELTEWKKKHNDKDKKSDEKSRNDKFNYDKNNLIVYKDKKSDFFLGNKEEKHNGKKTALDKYKNKKRNKLRYNENHTFSNCEMGSDSSQRGKNAYKVKHKKKNNVLSDSYLNVSNKSRKKKIIKEKLIPVWNGDISGEVDEEKEEKERDEGVDNRENKEEKNTEKKGKQIYFPKHKNINNLSKKTTNDYFSDYKSFEKKFNYFVKVSGDIKGSILSNSSDKISYAMNLKKKSYFSNLERIIDKCNKKEQKITFLDNYLNAKMKSNTLSEEDIMKHKNLLRNFYRKNTKGLIFENTLIKIYAKLYYCNESSGHGRRDYLSNGSTNKKSKRKISKRGNNNVNNNDDGCSNSRNGLRSGDLSKGRNNSHLHNENKNERKEYDGNSSNSNAKLSRSEGGMKKENIYMNIYIKSILYNIIYVKSDLSENKMDSIKVVKRNLKKNYNEVIEENDYINLKKNEICLLYTLCFKRNHLNNLPLFLNVECLNNDNTTIKLKVALPFPHLFLLKPNSLHLNNFVKKFPGKNKYYYKSYYYTMVGFSTFNEFINSLKLYNSFNVFHFDSYNILYSTYPINEQKKLLLLIVCDFVKKKAATLHDTVKLHFISLSNSLISFSINLFKQIL